MYDLTFEAEEESIILRELPIVEIFSFTSLFLSLSVFFTFYYYHCTRNKPF